MIFFVGLLVSFLGQLPVGYINLVAVKTSIEQTKKAGLYFALGIALVEVVYLVFIMYSLNFIFSNHTIYKIIQVITTIVFIIMAFLSFKKWKKQKTEIHRTATNEYTNTFINGIFLSCINLAQFPFWILWTSYLINLKILSSNTLQYPTFIIGTGFGTFFGLVVYIFGGSYLVQKIKQLAQNLELWIGIFFLIAAAFQVFHVSKSF